MRYLVFEVFGFAVTVVGPYKIGPLQLAIHVVQNSHAGEQKSHCDKTCMSFVCLCDFCSPAVLYHVNV